MSTDVHSGGHSGVPHSEPVTGNGAVPQRSSICTIIVTYNPDDTLEQHVRSLLPQVDRLIVVDNRSRDRYAIERVATSCGIEVIWNETNFGVATALNLGIERALSTGHYTWIAPFDQDSRVPPGYMQAMLAAYDACPLQASVAVIGPRYLCEPGPPDYNHQDRLPYKRIKTTMTSGSLVNSSVFERCGMFDESFFIDYVDHEFCLRLRRYGLETIEASKATLIHRLGTPVSRRFFSRTVVVNNYNATRRYYNARNRLRVYRKFLLSEPAWIIRDAHCWAKEVAKLMLFEQDRKRKMKAMLRGALDAVRGQ